MGINYGLCLLVCLFCFIKLGQLATGLPVANQNRLNEEKRQHWTASLRPGGKRSFEDHQLPSDPGAPDAYFSVNPVKMAARASPERQYWTTGFSPDGERRPNLNEISPIIEKLIKFGQWYNPSPSRASEKKENFGNLQISSDYTPLSEPVTCPCLNQLHAGIEEIIAKILTDFAIDYANEEYKVTPELTNYEGRNAAHRDAPMGIPLAQKFGEASIMPSLPLHSQESLDFDKPSINQ